MKFDNLKKDKGVAGTTVLLGLIVSLFIIGILVMIFALMGASLSNTSMVGASESASATQNGFTFTDGGTTLTACGATPHGAIYQISLINSTGSSVPASNYSYSGCVLTAVGSSTFNNTAVNATYNYTYGGAAFKTINGTVTSLSSVTTFFSLFIVIGSMVVLIMLTVIIIVAIRRSGMLDQASA